eukprot:COSAG01_NODE_19355_length_1014_cov_0.696507_2_plen_44_part_01
MRAAACFWLFPGMHWRAVPRELRAPRLNTHTLTSFRGANAQAIC